MSEIKPCNNCKRIDFCKVYSFINQNRKDMSAWEIDDYIRTMPGLPGLCSIIKASTDGEKIEIECAQVKYIKKSSVNYSNLLNSKPRAADDVCICPPSKSCKNGGGGCQGCKH
jgi:hypothetical protein